MIRFNHSAYREIGLGDYRSEKLRFQVELLKIQEWAVESGQRIAMVFEGRDAAGKGSTIKRFIENLMPKHFRVVELGIPTQSESRNWFARYKKHFPKPGEIVFFDRSWYTRALIEPTMGYCKRSQYTYFMSKVVDWEEKHIKDGLILLKFYLSVEKENQQARFARRIESPLKYWKYSPNDEQMQKRWEVFTRFKEQMFERTSTRKSPWVVLDSNDKMAARLNAMLYAVQNIPYSDKKPFVPLSVDERVFEWKIELNGVTFSDLNHKQYQALKAVQERLRQLEGEGDGQPPA